MPPFYMYAGRALFRFTLGETAGEKNSNLTCTASGSQNPAHPRSYSILNPPERGAIYSFQRLRLSVSTEDGALQLAGFRGPPNPG